jgi:hypothetical protein
MPAAICIGGVNKLLHSGSYWHFSQGHLLEAFRLLTEQGLYSPDLRLAFGGRQAVLPYLKRGYLSFYDAIFRRTPESAPKCKVENVSAADVRLLNFPPFQIDILRGEMRREFALAYNSSITASCRLLPALHAAALKLHRRSVRVRGERRARLLFLRRSGSSLRGINNTATVERTLQRVAESSGAIFQSVSFDDARLWRPLDQVRLLLETDVLVGYHGSGLGASLHWLPPASLVLEIAPVRWPYCVFAVCAAAGGLVHLTSTADATRRAEEWKPGGWFARHMPSGRRDVHLSAGLLRMLQIGLEAAAPAACDAQKGGCRPPRPTPRDAVNAAAALAESTSAPSSTGRCARACGDRMWQFWEPRRAAQGTTSE